MFFNSQQRAPICRTKRRSETIIAECRRAIQKLMDDSEPHDVTVFRSEHPNVIALSPNLPSHPGPWAGAGPVTDFQVDWRKKDPPSWPNQHGRKQSSSKVFDSSYQAHTPLTGSHSALMSRIDDLAVVQMVHIG